MRQYPRILFFINGPVPTEADYDAAEKLGPNCVFRNALLAEDEGSALEVCDGVAGQVPTRYADKRPTAEEAISAWTKTESERRMRVAAGLPETPVVDHNTVTGKAGTVTLADNSAAGDESTSAKATTPAKAAAKAATAPATAPAGAAAGWKAN